MKKTYKTLLAAVLVGLLTGPFAWIDCRGAASGHYTDMLPNPTSAPGVTSGTLYYNGYDWQMTTLGASLTPGDTISRAPMTVYQATAAATINATTVVSTITALNQGNVGSTTFPAAWVASGRSIEVTSYGIYSIPSGAGSTWTWAVYLGTTPIITTGAVTPPTSQVNGFFKANALMTIAATGNTGTVIGSYEILVTSGTSPNSILSFSTGTVAAGTTVDLTSQLTVNPTVTWGTANSSMTVKNVVVKFLN